jgi:streptogramin lyase
LWLPASAQNTLHGYDDVQLRGTINEPGSITLTGVGVQPFGTAFDAEGILWVSSFGSDALLFYTADQIDASGDPIPAATIADDGSGTLDGPVGIAFDSQGDLWVGNYLGNTLVQYTAQQLATATTAGGESFATP